MLRSACLSVLLLLCAFAFARGRDGAWFAEFEPVNPQLLPLPAEARAIVFVKGNEFGITLAAAGLPPGAHLIHLHGFTGGPAECPADSADVNGDGLIDAAEAEAVAGTMLMPFNTNPARLEYAGSGYPEADAQDGLLTFQASLSADRFASVFADNYSIVEWKPEDRVILIHGVPETTELPAGLRPHAGASAAEAVPLLCAPLRPFLPPDW